MRRSSDFILSKIWSHPTLSGVTFVTSRYSRHAFQPHFHDHYVIMVVDEGVNEGICEKQKYRVTTNDVLFINPGEIHTGYSYEKKDLQYSALYISCGFFAGYLSNYQSNSPTFTSLVKTDLDLTLRIKALIRSTYEHTSTLQIEEQKVRVFEGLLNNVQSSPVHVDREVPNTIVTKVKHYIRDNYRDEFSLAELSMFVGLSPYHLIRSFRYSVGMTPFQFLRNYRVEKAKELLRTKSIAEVAIDIGFYDQPHFHKYFKLVTGITPREFQRQQQ